MYGRNLNMKHFVRLAQHLVGLAILTCYHMEMGKVPSNMAGSQDALLPLKNGDQVFQTMRIIMQIMPFSLTKMQNGAILVHKMGHIAAVSINHPLQLQV